LLILSIATFIVAYVLYRRSFRNKNFKGIFNLICVFAVVILIGGSFLTYKGLQAEDFKRWMKNFESNYSGGLERRITVVNKDGEVIKEYTGKMDIEETTGDKIVFIIDGKKYIIYNSIFNTVFVEEI